MRLSNTKKGILFAFAGYNFFTLSDTCAKLLGNSYDVAEILFWSYLICLCLCLVCALKGGIKRNLGSQKLSLHLLRGCFMLFASVCAVTALTKGVSLPTFYTIIFLCPALTAIMAAVVYKERITRLGWSVIILGLAGIIIAFVKDASFSSPAIIYCFGVLFLGAIVNLMARPIGKKESMLTFPFYNSAVISISVLIYLLVYAKSGIPVPAMADVPVIVMGGIFVFFAQMFVMQGFRIGAHAYVAPMQYTQMLSGIAVGYYIFGNMPGPWVLVGAGMIIASGLLLITQKK